ncbi:MAG: glycosyltransferase family 2 protein [Phycisphaerales bacterium]
MISYILPTRNRPAELARTLSAISALGNHDAVGGAETIVADNASTPPVRVPDRLTSGIPIRLLRGARNEGAAARNAAANAADPDSRWLVMLDDDSHPLDRGFFDALRQARPEVGAIQAEITLPCGTREAGGLPEVFIGCGVAIRREAFCKLGGYDHAFDYYAEEYDLAARLLRAGYRVALDRRFRVEHRKVSQGRDFARILRRLVRNNAWVAQRYAPEDVRFNEIQETLARYARIAWRERVPAAYLRGLADLAFSLGRQTRQPLSAAIYDRLTGLAHARAALAAANCTAPLGACALVSPGKNAWAVGRALHELGARMVDDPARADTLVVATLSPGPMLDALDLHTSPAAPHSGKRVVLPWAEAMAPARVHAAATLSREAPAVALAAAA